MELELTMWPFQYRRIREAEKQRDGQDASLIVALTGLAAEQDRLEAKAAGVDIYLAKPVPFKRVGGLLGERGLVG